MKLATAAQMREIDRRAIEEFAIPGLVLMENAAIRIADEIGKRYYKRSLDFVVACGLGNNGADGIAVARHLMARYGAFGSIWLCGEPNSTTTPEHDLQLEIARRMGINVARFHEKDFASEVKIANVVIDALVGTGAKGGLRPVAAAAAKTIRYMRQFEFYGHTVAVDIPSGVDSDTGAVGEIAIRADLTVTLGISKVGLHLSPAYDYVGELVIADLGYPKQVLGDNADLKVLLTAPKNVASWLPDRSQKRDTNKSTYGAVALFAGSQGFAGAATLCCKGAARAGAGLVSLAVPKGMLDVMMSRVPDVVMTRGFEETAERRFSAAALPEALEFVAKLDAVGIGPGIGHEGAEIQSFVKQFVAQCPKPMVLDADVLTILAAESDHGASIVKSRSAATVLTPHPGEMGRLLGISSKEVQADRLGSVRRAAELFGCVALLKGDRTLIAAPDGRLAINETGNAGMASGGMGDTLTGIMTAFLGQMDDAFAAAATAAYVHGLAGDLAAEHGGRAGLMASDLDGFIPAAIWVAIS